MTTLLVTFILSFCGDQDTPKQNQCYDYINNCVVGKSGEIKQDKFEQCAKEYLDEQ